jgi:LPXTG-motif cell wall-anchored protein
VSPSVAAEGGTIDVTGCGTPGATQTFVLTSHPQTLGTAVTNPGGFFSARLTIPCGTEQGAHTLTARESGGRSQSAALTVDGAVDPCPGAGAGGSGAGSQAGGGALPRTGTASLAPLTAAGVGLVLIGGFAVTVVRRRSFQAEAS